MLLSSVNAGDVYFFRKMLQSGILNSFIEILHQIISSLDKGGLRTCLFQRINIIDYFIIIVK